MMLVINRFGNTLCWPLGKRYALFWDIMRRRVVIVYQRFGTTYQSHPQGSRVQEEKKARNRNINLHGKVRAGGSQ
jgi:hypothetical protein